MSDRTQTTNSNSPHQPQEATSPLANIGSYFGTIYNYTFGWIFNSLYDTCIGIAYFIRRIFWGTPSITPLTTDVENSGAATNSYTSFIQNFERNFGREHVNFSESSLSKTMVDAIQVKKPMLIFIHDTHSDDSSFYCTEYFSNPSAISTLNANFVIWAANSVSREAVRACQKHHLSSSHPNVFYYSDSSAMFALFALKKRLSFERFLRKCVEYGVFGSEELVDVDGNRARSSDPSSLGSNLIELQNEAYEQLIQQEQQKQNKIKEEMDRAQQKIDSASHVKEELKVRVQKSAGEYQELTQTELDYADPSQLITLRIYYPDRKSTQVRCIKTDPIKRVVDHIFVSNPDISKKFSLSLPVKKHEFFRYGDDETVSCETCSIDSSYRITLAYLSSDEEVTSDEELNKTPNPHDSKQS